MPTSAQRIVPINKVVNFGTLPYSFEISDLTRIQTEAYDRFLQVDVDPRERRDEGLEAILRETFPIESSDQKYRLEYIRYELGKPRFTPLECRQLKQTYGRPFYIWLRLTRSEPVEEQIYLCDLPIMLGGGEFIINGAERVVVSQLHRSPGIDFKREEEADRKIISCRIIPERGSWIELMTNKNDALTIVLDMGPKFPVMTFLRAMGPEYGSTTALIRLFYPTQVINANRDEAVQLLEGKYAAEDIIYPPGHERCGEIIVEACHAIDRAIAEEIRHSTLKNVEVITEVRDPLCLNSLLEDPTMSYEDALLRFYQKARPGNPPQLEKAIELFRERFFNPNRYRLGRVGRFRLNRKLDGHGVPDTEMVLHPLDLVNAIRYISRLRLGDPNATCDDIDNLGNRRLRTIDELAAEDIRKGFLKLRRTVQERMSMKDMEEQTPRALINTKSIQSAVEQFFGRSELSQVVDQTNPLSTLAHERRLSALGPGGLNRKRAGFEARDVHISHYGRICPIETPEGTNIGLISYLSVYAKVDDYGFLITPYRRVVKRQVTDEIVWLRADEEARLYIAPADTPVVDGKLAANRVLVRHDQDTKLVSADDVQFIDVASNQIVGVSAGLIPFLEHDDANRALMGSNMQRQAVPLLVTEVPLVGTGLERAVVESSGMVLRAEKPGKVTYVDAEVIEIDGKRYPLRKYTGLNERTCLNQKPLVKVGQKVKKGEVLVDSAATRDGELALGRNVLVAFMSWEGYNFEDAIILSERLVKEDVYTSIHIEVFEEEVRETKLGREEFTRDIPNVGEKALRNLDEHGIVRVGARVVPGDILVGKVAPKTKTELTPEEKLLQAIFGRAGEDVKNASKEVPPGVEGIVIHTERFSRKTGMSDKERREHEAEIKRIQEEGDRKIAAAFRNFLAEFEAAYGGKLKDDHGRDVRSQQDDHSLAAFAERFLAYFEMLDLKSPQKKADCRRVIKEHWPAVEAEIDDRDSRLNSMKRGDALPTGVLEKAIVYVASKRQISVGDKMAGRHGNKGVISKILPEEDMPFLEDGTPVDIILNPLGVPSRMNVGQILETHLGWACAQLGIRAKCPVFDGPSEEVIRNLLKEAGLPEDGKVRLYDGRTGEPFEQRTTVGFIYMLKLHHLVDDKVHARATGPYSLITQQPLGGKARAGGQRLGEMEVWALEAYGAAYILQELLTVKSDDVEGRTKIYEDMVKGTNTLKAGTPASFDVLCNEIRGLCLNIELEKAASKDDVIRAYDDLM